MSSYNSIELKLREAELEDAEVIFNWVMDKETRRNAPNPKPFSFSSHKKWFEQKIQSNDLILIAEAGQNKIGILRFDVNQNKDEIDVSIVVNPDFRGKGFGAKIIGKGLKKLKSKIGKDFENLRLRAIYFGDNLGSKHIFLKNGFKETEEFKLFDNRKFHVLEFVNTNLE